MSDERPRRTAHGQDSKTNSSSGWQLVAVQSISCLVVVLIVFVFRMVGGSAFAQLRNSFNQSIMDNSLIATVAALLDTPAANEKTDSDNSGVSNASEEASATGNANEDTSESTTTPQETSTPTQTTDNSADAASGSTEASSQQTAGASGGKDIPVTTKKVLYAPEGAAFVPLKVNRMAVKPIESGKISSYFGYRENPTKGGDSFHLGLDIAADTGTPIAAMYFGVVSETGNNSSYGNYIKVYHGSGLEILYAHCSEILVQKESVVKAGGTVAKVGSTGDSTGPHVHIEAIHNGINYDPLEIIPPDTYA